MSLLRSLPRFFCVVSYKDFDLRSYDFASRALRNRAHKHLGSYFFGTILFSSAFFASSARGPVSLWLRFLGAKLGQCRVGEGPEIAEHIWWFRRVHHALGEKDADHILGWIDVGRGPGSAVPTESAGVMG
jgi:hypothetical protein